jgi:hypothetical protein
MKIYMRIRHYIVSNGIMLKYVAEKSEIPQQRFYRLMNGSSEMTADEYESICKKGLGIDPGYFFAKKFSENEKSA